MLLVDHSTGQVYGLYLRIEADQLSTPLPDPAPYGGTGWRLYGTHPDSWDESRTVAVFLLEKP